VTPVAGTSVEIKEGAVTDRELKDLGLGARSTSAERWLPAVVEDAMAPGDGLFSVRLGNGRIYGVPSHCWRPVSPTALSPAPGGAHGQILKLPSCGCTIVGAGTLRDPLSIVFCAKHAEVR